ncbi:fatty acid oxidation complex subunit alpha FadB [Thiothrix nivea]|uniref:enoyl-CoA hydratase n=1 Tax=Thiothrix nivea (strain ATCC 35100 / DSM 5205 / JP2) TaxID=870187 RepID=A0A656HGS3_THINJ|nr:fatty acid oxidation complex subunit alpha FadB [Thiothrix nivea]EIJ36108.1 3-hydroxyacyl-CoA dehydrogenase; short chain enoyl-CoA hydratase [Thiothrix nivea DSM 5205]
MLYTGKTLSLQALDHGQMELVLDAQGAAVNALNSVMVTELRAAVQLLEQVGGVTGLLVSSAKPAFVVGADVTEFQAFFALPDAGLTQWLLDTQAVFSQLESLPFPTVAMVNGLALGGGFELALACDLRVLNAKGKVGLPEVTLGLCPGWGGTVRLSRLAGVETALAWAVTGKPAAAAQALAQGAVDRVAAEGQLRETALALLQAASAGDVDYRAKRQQKQASVTITADALSAAHASQTARLDRHYPAPWQIADMLCQHAHLPFADALRAEAECFTLLARTDAASSLLGLFFNDQVLKKKTRAWGKQAAPVKQSAVLGAGIMGGGVAYQSALFGIPMLMKDINGAALDLGSKTIQQLLDRQVQKGTMTAEKKAAVLAAVKPTLDYSDFAAVDLVVEAVVENPAIKQRVLQEIEGLVAEDAVLTSNTSTISITSLAEGLARPAQFCGMHFFNPVPQMPLVEIIRGALSSDATIARAVAYADAIGKAPIVVNDCPGFLVNRILFPYFNGFNRLLKDGVDFQRIDKVMEAFGWPMGPAYLADVVGLDTMVHADEVMQAGFPERMGHDGETVIEALVSAGCLGQKNGKGFYEYGVDERGKRFKRPTALAQTLNAVTDARVTSDQDIIDRMMIPLCTEAVRCLDDGIVETAAEVDMGLILGLGFPRFRGGALRYLDTLGLSAFAGRVSAHAVHGALYTLPAGVQARLASASSFY